MSILEAEIKEMPMSNPALKVPSHPIEQGPAQAQMPMPTATAECENRREELRQEGFRAAAHQDADPQKLAGCLGGVYLDYKRSTKSREQECRAKISELGEINSKLFSDIGRTMEERICPDRARINALKAEMEDMAVHPESYAMMNQFSPFRLACGTFLLIVVLISLLVFYSSSSYSAFIRNLGEDLQAVSGSPDLSTLFSTVFNPNALNEARRKGAYALAMTIGMPFIFVTAGYLLHLFSTSRKSVVIRALQISGVYLFVVCADFIIAYKITQGVYEAKVMTGLVQEPWAFTMVWSDVNFYLVMVAGFVSYLLWGILLNQVVDEVERMQYLRAARRSRWETICQLEEGIAKAEGEINAMKEQVRCNEEEIGRQERLLKAHIINWDDLNATFDTFFSGWTCYVAALYSSAEDPVAKKKIERAKEELARYKQSILDGLKPTGNISIQVQ
jgi:hypothetical protein